MPAFSNYDSWKLRSPDDEYQFEPEPEENEETEPMPYSTSVIIDFASMRPRDLMQLAIDAMDELIVSDKMAVIERTVEDTELSYLFDYFEGTPAYRRWCLNKQRAGNEPLTARAADAAAKAAEAELDDSMPF